MFHQGVCITAQSNFSRALSCCRHIIPSFLVFALLLAFFVPQSPCLSASRSLCLSLFPITQSVNQNPLGIPHIYSTPCVTNRLLRGCKGRQKGKRFTGWPLQGCLTRPACSKATRPTAAAAAAMAHVATIVAAAIRTTLIIVVAAIASVECHQAKELLRMSKD